MFTAMPAGCTITMPLLWFLSVLHAAMLKMVIPVTATTRRVEKLLKLKMPIEGLVWLMELFGADDIPGLKWELLPNAERRLLPTKSTRANHIYKYEIIKGKHQDLLWRLQDTDTQKNKKEVAFKRGFGATRLILSRTAAIRGELTCLLAMVCGKTTIKMTQPRDC